MKFYLANILVWTAFFVSSQKDSLNKFDPYGEKTSYWVAYFDNNMIQTDSLRAYFIGLEIYDAGQKLWLFPKIKRKRKLYLEYAGKMPRKGYPVLVDGTFKWYNKKHILMLEETFKKGLPFIHKVYERTNYSDTVTYLAEMADFTKQFDNLPGSHYSILYSQDGRKTSEAWYRKIRGKWKWQTVK